MNITRTTMQIPQIYPVRWEQMWFIFLLEYSKHKWIVILNKMIKQGFEIKISLSRV